MTGESGWPGRALRAQRDGSCLRITCRLHTQCSLGASWGPCMGRNTGLLSWHSCRAPQGHAWICGVSLGAKGCVQGQDGRETGPAHGPQRGSRRSSYRGCGQPHAALRPGIFTSGSQPSQSSARKLLTTRHCQPEGHMAQPGLAHGSETGSPTLSSFGQGRAGSPLLKFSICRH